MIPKKVKFTNRRFYSSIKMSGLTKRPWTLPTILVLSTACIITYNITIKSITEQHNELQTDYFVPYRITRKVYNDKNHFLMELTPLKEQRVNIWSQLTNRNLWSVEVKQPEIMVVRNYTPLPLKFKNSTDVNLEIISDDNINNEKGKLLFYIKSYEHGEVSKWLSNLPLEHIIELRGPFIEYNIPQPVNKIHFYSAGTGIVSSIQILLNPFKNGTPKLNLFYSCNNMKSELGPLKNFLSKYVDNNKNTTDMRIFEDSKNENFSNNLKNFMKLIPTSKTQSLKNEISLVCGPDRYIETIAGKRYDLSQGPISGILSKKGWSEENVYKLS